jgi:hypothetical protein
VPTKELQEVLLNEADAKDENSDDVPKRESKPDGKLVVAEEIKEGHIGGNSGELHRI